jgi:hypothetical protein
MNKLLLLLLIAPVFGFSQEVETPPEILFCEEATKYVNSKQYEERKNPDRTASEREEFKQWLKLFTNLMDEIISNGVLYGEKIGIREVEGGFQDLTFNSLMAKNCEAYMKMLSDMGIADQATSEIIKYED